MKNAKKWARVLSIAISVLVLSAFPVLAQSTSSSINGTVQDSTGAVVSNAVILVTNTATNEHVTATAHSDGEYTVLNLPPGTYGLTVTAKGFPKYEQHGILLELNQHATIAVTLPVGSVQQDITVNADVNGLDTTSATLSSEVNGTSIQNLPLNTREPYSLLALVPGFSGTIGNDYNGVVYSINGGDSQFGDILVDGTPAGFPTVQGYQGVGVFPSVDAIGQFRLLASNFPAEYGRTLDGIVNVVYKSGTNQFHGTAFEFHRDNFLGANSFFNNRNGVGLQAFRRNQYGGVLDGPIWRDKVFFLVNVEQLSQVSAATPLTATVPTLAQRAGDFSSTFASNGSLIKIYDPFTTTYNATTKTYSRTQYQGNKILPTELSNVGQHLLQYFPLPNATPSNSTTNANNYYAVGTTVSPVRAWDVRIDDTINAKSSIFARYSNRLVSSTPPTYLPSAISAATTTEDTGDQSNGVAIGYTNALTQRTVLDVRFGFARTLYDYRNKSLGFQDSSLGLPGFINSAPGNANISYFPTINTSGYLTLGQTGDRHNAFQTGSVLGALTLERGKHVFKIGFDGRQIRVNDHELSQAAGDFTFGTNFTQGPNASAASSTAGNGFASLLIGTGTGQVIQDSKNVATQSYYTAEYFQDDWRVVPKLTLNLGLRYDLDSPRTERFNQTNYFDPNAATPLSSDIQGITGGLVYVGVNGRSRHQYNIDWNNLAPRVGLAWNPLPNTVVHAGGAIVYGASNQAASGDAAPTGWAQTDTWVSSLDGVTPLNTIDNPYPSGFPAINPVQSGILTGAGGAISGVIQHSPTPYSIQWGLDIQQQIPFGITTDIAYVGNRGRQLITSFESGENADQLPTADLSLGSALSNSVANPFYGDPNIKSSQTLAAKTTTAGQLLLPHPQFTSVLVYHLMGGDSQYDGLQLTLNKRLSNGIQLQTSYTWSKNFDNGSSHQDSYNPKADYAISTQDIHQRFVLSYLYQLPFGRGRRWASNASKWEDYLIGGWQLNGITTLQGGQPLQILGTNSLSTYNFAKLYANTNFQNAAYHGPTKNRLTQYFNTADFSQPAAFTLGNGPAYYSNLRSPGVDNTDFSIFKELKPIEKVTLQIRAEAFNIANHPQFGSPNTTVTSTSFGTITSQSNSPRQVQFGGKLIF